MIRSIAKLPQIKIDLNMLMLAVESRKDLISFPSSIKGLGYVGCEDDGIIIVSSKQGYIRIDEDDIPAVVEELQEYHDQLKMRRKL